MSTRIIRNMPEGGEKFVLKEFSSAVERGEQEYSIRPFAADEEVSVQESRMDDIAIDDPQAVENREDEITDDDYLPPSKLVKAEDGLVGERVEMPSGGASFVEAGMFSDAEEHVSEYPTKVLRQDGNMAGDEKIAALAEEKTALEVKLNELNGLLEAKTKEMEELRASFPPMLEKAKAEGKAEGFDEGIKDGEEKSRKAYEAERDDYLSKLEAFNKEALKKLDDIDSTIKSIDDEMGKTVIGFVKSIIGAERRINDAFVIRLIRANSDRLRELKVVKFVSNPADAEIVKKVFKDYPVEESSQVPKGGIKIISKAGEVDLDSSTMIADLEKQINETIGTPLKP